MDHNEIQIGGESILDTEKERESGRNSKGEKREQERGRQTDGQIDKKGRS